MDKIKELIAEIEQATAIGEKATEKLKDMLYFYSQRLKQYAIVIQNSPLGVIIYDRKGIVKYINPKFEEQSGYKKEEIIEKSVATICIGSWCTEIHNKLLEFKEKDPIWRGFLTRKHKNGSEYKVKATLASIKNGDPKDAHFVSMEEIVKDG